MKILRWIGGLLAGIVAVGVFVGGSEAIVHRMVLPLPGMDQDFALVKKYVAALPLSALLVVLSGWLLGTFVGTVVASQIARSSAAGYVLGALLLAVGIVNSIIIPQAVWFSCVSLVIYIAMTLAGTRLAGRRVSSS